MLVASKRTGELEGWGSCFLGASVRGSSWLPLRLPIRCQKGLKPPLLATRIRRKYLALSAGYELLSKLQNLYASVRSRPAPPIPPAPPQKARHEISRGSILPVPAWKCLGQIRLND